MEMGDESGGLLHGLYSERFGYAGCWLLSMVCVIDGIRGTVISLARALYRKICDVALKSPRGSAVTIMTAF
jgi:hypothetical protein